MKPLHTLKRYAAEIARAIRNGRYEETPTGLVLPHSKLAIGGVFTAFVDGAPAAVARGHNTIMLVTLNLVLNAIRNGTMLNTYYIAPFANNLAPVNTLTAATFDGTQNEFDNYTGGTRPAWTTNGDATAQELSNSNARASYTMDTGGGTIYGAGLLTSSEKNATTGVLFSAGLFDAAVILNAGGILQIQYDLGAEDAS